ncbi:ATP-binding protein [Streptomyces sp. SID13666]|uniref:ATP-binding protein n=1 Tax=Streptomyces TaxID=1883 RepID=UPI0011072AD5|nr:MULTISPECIES: ATP-binding protein [Streptomyces]MCZ4101366.1 ATP-binding protein [Streptomyces sp. H39-C1]NEA53854.1 ATP-binding protein [Streptomyces sp. SID13666]NEA75490.1 ATP-binding protein [Streptomyces sp. SID13588]QNA76827.1 ATP-binding protein [Streptomyces sp. So13.3]
MLTDPAGGRAGEPAECLLKVAFTGEDLPRLRVLIEQRASLAGLSEPRRGEFVLAMDALASNVVEHAGGDGALALTRVGDELECRISDSGPGFSEDVIPELAPGINGGPAGRGLWLTRLLADRLVIAAASPGAVVTFAMRLA